MKGKARSAFDLRMKLVPDQYCKGWDYLRFSLQFGRQQLTFPEESMATRSLAWLEPDLAHIVHGLELGAAYTGPYRATCLLDLCPSFSPLVSEDDLWLDLTFENLISTGSSFGLHFRPGQSIALRLVTPAGELWSWRPDLVQIRKLYGAMHSDTFRTLRHNPASFHRLTRRGVVIGRGGQCYRR